MENEHSFYTIKKAIHFIAENYQKQPDLDEIAESVYLSKFHFQRLFQKWAGISPKGFLQYITIEHAKKCLAEGRSTLDTASDVGLSGNSRLHDLFIKIEGCTPGDFKKRGKGLKIKYDIINTPFGKAGVAETEIGICGISFLEENEHFTEYLKRDFFESEIVKGLGVQGSAVNKYFSDWKVPSRNIVLDLRGTPFQIMVWKSLLTIPSSNLIAYNDVAQMIHESGAVRAVGTAIARNPIAYLIPCHRVIRQSGQIGDYRWGRDRKAAIIGYENVRLSKNRMTWSPTSS